MAQVSTEPAVLRGEQISRRYGRQWVVRRVDLALDRGECLLLIGPNGAGKTTLLRIISTLLPLHFGRLALFGREASGRSRSLRRRIGLLTSRLSLYEDLSARQNLDTLARLLRADRSQVSRLLDRVSLSGLSGRPARYFSTGMRKRLALAALMLQDPDLLLLDEPYEGLDPEGMALVDDLVGDWRARGKAVVVATHYIERGRSVADRLVHLDGGVVTARRRLGQASGVVA